MKTTQISIKTLEVVDTDYSNNVVHLYDNSSELSFTVDFSITVELIPADVSVGLSEEIEITFFGILMPLFGYSDMEEAKEIEIDQSDLETLIKDHLTENELDCFLTEEFQG